MISWEYAIEEDLKKIQKSSWTVNNNSNNKLIVLIVFMYVRNSKNNSRFIHIYKH